jgi:hypothetical protein
MANLRPYCNQNTYLPLKKSYYKERDPEFDVLLWLFCNGAINDSALALSDNK